MCVRATCVHTHTHDLWCNKSQQPVRQVTGLANQSVSRVTGLANQSVSQVTHELTSGVAGPGQPASSEPHRQLRYRRQHLDNTTDLRHQ